MNINQILKKDFASLNKEETFLITQELWKRFAIEHKRQDKSGIYAYVQYKMAYHSNNMEGSKLTEDQTRSLFDTGTLPSSPELYRAKDTEEATGHFMMFNEMIASYKQPLSEALIKKFHFRLKQGVFEDMANGYPCGEYKNRINYVSDIQTAHPSEVSKEMKDLLSWYQEHEKTLDVLAMFHAKFERIHPFQDGNGRTGRLILFRECLEHGILPVFIRKEAKMDYKFALNKAQKENNFQELMEVLKASQALFYGKLQEFLYEFQIEKTEAPLISTDKGLLTPDEIKKLVLNGKPPEILRPNISERLKKEKERE